MENKAIFQTKKLKYIANVLDQFRKPITADKRNQNADILYDYYGASGAIDKMSIANTLRGPYQSDKYKDVIIPMVIVRRFECALAKTKAKVVAQFKKNPNYPYKAMCKISGFQFYNTSEYTLAELLNDSEHIASNFKSYLNAFSPNVQEIIMSNSSGLFMEIELFV